MDPGFGCSTLLLCPRSRGHFAITKGLKKMQKPLPSKIVEGEEPPRMGEMGSPATVTSSSVKNPRHTDLSPVRLCAGGSDHALSKKGGTGV